MPNGHKLYQNIPNGHKIYQHLPFKGPQKFTQIWDFWFENKPSGNPVPLTGTSLNSSELIEDRGN
jgi:hypothetical protein